MSYSTNVRINDLVVKKAPTRKDPAPLNQKQAEKRNQENLKIANIAVTQYKKYYNNVYLITDTKGEEIFKDINFTKIFNILDIVPKEYKGVWSLGKMYAIKHIASLKKQFCHSDMDFIIRKPFKENISNAEVFAQSYEYSPYLWNAHYKTDLFYDLCKNKYLATDAFNQLEFTSVIPERSVFQSYGERFSFAPLPLCCGILGGKNYDFFYEYASTSINMVQDPQNAPYWLDPQIEKDCWGTKAITAEQFYLACCLKKYQIKPELIFDAGNFIDYDPLENEGVDFQHWVNEKKEYILRCLEEKEFLERYMKYLEG